LGMDWLAMFEANILCKQMTILLRGPDGSQITVYGDRAAHMSRVISVIRASELLKQGCGSYLVYVVNHKAKAQELHDVPMVRDFPNVFLEDLLGIPPDREIEFQIDLFPGAQPVA
jgi:hypothetical protein